jgi:hypothetical protein
MMSIYFRESLNKFYLFVFSGEVGTCFRSDIE